MSTKRIPPQDYMKAPDLPASPSLEPAPTRPDDRCISIYLSELIRILKGNGVSTEVRRAILQEIANNNAEAAAARERHRMYLCLKTFGVEI